MDFARHNGETTAQWLERLVNTNAPADIRADVREILANERQAQEQFPNNFLFTSLRMNRHCSQCNLAVPAGTVLQNPICFNQVPHNLVDDAVPAGGVDVDVIVERALKKAKVIVDTSGNLSDTAYAQKIERVVPWQPVAYNAPGRPSILTQPQLQNITNSANQDEHRLIALLTPRLVQITEAVGSCFINSEECAWIPQVEGVTTPATDRQPDAFSCTAPLFVTKSLARPALRTLRTNALLAGQTYNNAFRCGEPHWKIKDFYVIWEFKWVIGEGDRGIVYAYLTALSRGDPDSSYFAFLCDSTRVNIISCTHGTIAATSQSFHWTDPGSVIAVQNVVQRVGFKQSILNTVAANLHATVTGFLGSGAFGRCFSVTVPAAAPIVGNVARALKVVQYEGNVAHADTLVNDEFYKMLNLSADLPVMKVVPGSRQIALDATTGVALGCGYLMTNVGVSAVPPKGHIVTVDLLRRLLRSLSLIHAAGHYHGDARIQNVVSVGNRLQWIDFMSSGDLGAGANAVTIRKDVDILLASTVDRYRDVARDQVFDHLLTAYCNGPSNDTADAILSHIRKHFTRKTM